MKQKKLLISATAVVFGGLHLFGSTSVPPLYIIRTEITLPASPEKSWKVLTDFARYPEWNPHFPRGRHSEMENVIAVALTRTSLLNTRYANSLLTLQSRAPMKR